MWVVDRRVGRALRAKGWRLAKGGCRVGVGRGLSWRSANAAAATFIELLVRAFKCLCRLIQPASAVLASTKSAERHSCARTQYITHLTGPSVWMLQYHLFLHPSHPRYATSTLRCVCELKSQQSSPNSVIRFRFLIPA